MKLSDFDYHLPKELIAKNHCQPRDHSWLLVVNRKSKQIEHKKFYDILGYLKKGDILVFNNSKVFKARIFGKKETGGKIEFLLIRNIVGEALCGRPSSVWEVLAKGKVKVGDKVFFKVHSGSTQEYGANNVVPLGRTSGRDLEAEVLEKNERTLKVRFNISAEKMFEYLEKFGEIPLPPYIKKNFKLYNCSTQASSPEGALGANNSRQFAKNSRKLASFYQTVYADKIGSVAAPTAGFHFTPELLKKIKAKGVECLNVTLHVGPGTFLPVETENITEHKMHEEFFEIEKDVWGRILVAKKEKHRIIAVGTTTVRVLETMADENYKFQISNDKQITNYKLQKRKIFGSTKIFIYPPYDFKIVEALITNFHLPKSTLLMLVAAFLAPKKKNGVKKIKEIYKEAVKKKYRFYSFGDSMFIFDR